MDGLTPISLRRLPKAMLVYWAYSTGRRNTLIMEVFMGRPAGWMQKLTGRGAMRSPGAPSLRREVEREFWEQIATGMTSKRATEVVGVSQKTNDLFFAEFACSHIHHFPD